MKIKINKNYPRNKRKKKKVQENKRTTPRTCVLLYSTYPVVCLIAISLRQLVISF